MAMTVDESCDAATGEPPLVWYSSQDPSRNSTAAEEFSRAYPQIPIEHLRLATGALATRYAQEREAGVINADLISLADPNFIAQGMANEWFVPLTSDSLPRLTEIDPAWINKGAVTTSLSMLGFAYNSEAVGDTPPTSWEDLLAPRFAGKIIMGDPRNVPSYMALFRILRDELGADYLTRLAAQQPILVPSVVPATQQLAAGEVTIVVPNVMTVVRVLSEQGAPIEFVAPDLTTGNEFETAVSAGADSPNAAMCFLSFLLSEEGQTAYNGMTSVSPFPGTPGTAPMPSNYIAPRITEIGDHATEISGLLGLK
ncbi:MAG: extracellular solute-binding protein [Gemmobacter sp.]|nr:extracellular solute-binding protein [Gemmobacter sp.]